MNNCNGRNEAQIVFILPRIICSWTVVASTKNLEECSHSLHVWNNRPKWPQKLKTAVAYNLSNNHKQYLGHIRSKQAQGTSRVSKWILKHGSQSASKLRHRKNRWVQKTALSTINYKKVFDLAGTIVVFNLIRQQGIGDTYCRILEDISRLQWSLRFIKTLNRFQYKKESDSDMVSAISFTACLSFQMQ